MGVSGRNHTPGERAKMRPCTRVGLETTWRCNWTCDQCFFLRHENFHKPLDVPVEEITAKIDQASPNRVVRVDATKPPRGEVARALAATVAREREAAPVEHENAVGV